MTTAVQSQDEGIERCLKWLVSLQTSVLQEEYYALLDDVKNENGLIQEDNGYLFQVQGASVTIPNYGLQAKSSLEVSKEDLQWAGLTGRCNKIADTCYTFWTGGSLGVRYSRHYLI